jgi:hypothetical protein
MKSPQTCTQFWVGAVGGLLLIAGLASGVNAWRSSDDYIVPASGRSGPMTRKDVMANAVIADVIGSVLLYYSFRGTEKS